MKVVKGKWFKWYHRVFRFLASRGFRKGSKRVVMKPRCTDRGIMFTGEMVRAILEGRKTETRRLRGLKKINEDPDAWEYDTIREDESLYALLRNRETGELVAVKCPYGICGDTIYVKETWACGESATASGYGWYPHQNPDPAKRKAVYRASARDYAPPLDHPACDIKWRSAMLMPRWAARIRHTITDIRLERVGDITDEGAKAEGVRMIHGGAWDYFAGCESQGMTARQSFRTLWDTINAAKGMGMERNPWVWVVKWGK